MNHERDQEARRQQALLRTLWRQAPEQALDGWLREAPRNERGLGVYRANAGALAERALADAYPTLAQIVGPGSFAALARAFWFAEPPRRGDIGEWGGALAGFVAEDAQLATEPYLADVARLEWAVHRAGRAADPAPRPAGIEGLADADPAALTLRLQPGSALVASSHPIVTIWHAHRDGGAERFAPVRAAFAAGRGERAWVRRRGWTVAVSALDAPAAAFAAALLAGRSLAAALGAAGLAFDFENWLIEALTEGSIAAVQETAP